MYQRYIADITQQSCNSYRCKAFLLPTIPTADFTQRQISRHQFLAYSLQLLVRVRVRVVGSVRSVALCRLVVALGVRSSVVGVGVSL